MNEENIMVTDDLEFNEAFNDAEVTDLAPVEDDNSPKIGGTEIALGALAAVGAGFLIKKAYDGGKWAVGKIKSGIANLKDKKSKARDCDDQETPAEPQEANEEAAEPEKVQGDVE